ncbi:MAG: hypothetical protein H6729_04200 [Deltaproteobacteria bacterium]|nr:hypothetical protein [Deltaproteobacteria bacterium]
MHSGIKLSTIVLLSSRAFDRAISAPADESCLEGVHSPRLMGRFKPEVRIVGLPDISTIFFELREYALGRVVVVLGFLDVDIANVRRDSCAFLTDRT